MSSDYVHKYLWYDHSLSGRKAWIMTLHDNHCIAFLAFMTLFITYTQRRGWLVFRDFFNFLTRSPRLPDEAIDKIRSTLSQGDAIRILLQARQRRRIEPASTIETISPWLGVIAIANIACFVALGLTLPVTLTGSLETPVVRSRMTHSCIGFEERFETMINNAHLADTLFKQCWYNQSTDSNGCGSINGVLNGRPKLTIDRREGCIFPGDVCQKGVKSIQLSHHHMPLYQFGVNSKSRVLTSHRLACSPLTLDPFINVYLNSRTLLNQSLLTFDDWSRLPESTDSPDYGFATVLDSANGPNIYSNESSGRMAAVANKPYLLSVWPYSPLNQSEAIKKFHPSLRVSNGTVFIVGFRAGGSYYPYPVDDPLFSAHDLYMEDPKRFLPDFEITALGCIEQYRFCIEEKALRCTIWDSEGDNLISLFEDISAKGDNNQPVDYGVFLTLIYQMNTVLQYLLSRGGTQVLLASRYRVAEVMLEIDPKEQWVAEVTAWFETAFLSTRYHLFNMITRGHAPDSMYPLRRQFGEICNRVVFRDGSYTNIDFLQLLMVLFGLIMINLISIQKRITAVAIKAKGVCWELLKKIGSHCRSAATSSLSWLKSIRWKRQRIPGRFPISPFWRRRDERRLPVELNQFRVWGSEEQSISSTEGRFHRA